MTVRDTTISNNQGRVLSYIGGPALGHYEEEFGGEGAFGTMPDYLKILRSLLADDGKLLTKESTAEMFKPQLGSESQKSLQKIFGTVDGSRFYIGVFPEDVQYDWGLGGLLTMEDVNVDGRRWRRKGCMVWSGLANLFWVSSGLN
jgi:hypothetical protein